MIKSMTGFGLASNNYEHAKYTVEIKSLNSKFLELSLKLPKSFSDKELILRNECSKLIERGKVHVSFTVEYAEAGVKAATISRQLLSVYYTQLENAANELGAGKANLLQLALNFPDVIQYPEEQVTDEEWKLFHLTFEQALANFQTFRRDEGAVLQQDLELRIRNILNAHEQIELLEPKRIPLIRERLNNYLAEAIGKESIDHNRFEQELIFYIDKLDITEEKIRLRSHCNYFTESLKDTDANGKKLAFISQEIGREINTIGSKANDAGIQQLVIGMKEELEKIKEQLLNVL